LSESVKLLKEALQDCTTVPTHLSQAIDITIKYPDLCEKISWWKEGLWEFIEEFLNTKPENINDEYFIQACALLN
jgi:hypothetical protein